MRIRLLSFSFLLLYLNEAAFSQTFQIYSEDTVLVNTDPYELFESHAEITNTLSGIVRTIVKREPVSLAPNHINYFCWGINCYGPTTIQSPDTIELEGGGTNTTFKGYIDPNGFVGTSSVRYCFINASNPSDRSCYLVKYTSSITSVIEAEPGRSGGVAASYDPVSQTIRVVVNGGKLDFWNMLGQKIEMDWKYDGSAMVANASSLKPGYYFIFGTAADGRLWSARVIVTK